MAGFYGHSESTCGLQRLRMLFHCSCDALGLPSNGWPCPSVSAHLQSHLRDWLRLSVPAHPQNLSELERMLREQTGSNVEVLNARSNEHRKDFPSYDGIDQCGNRCGAQVRLRGTDQYGNRCGAQDR